MKSVHLFVRDATGVQYLDTFADNTPEQIAAFRKHAAWWKGYARTATYKGDHRGQPCFPVEIFVEPY